jgi:hypothetical protein
MASLRRDLTKRLLAKKAGKVASGSGKAEFTNRPVDKGAAQK